MTPSRPNEQYGPTWQLQAATVARMFFIEDRSKVEIAQELGLSRFKVARILEEARARGLVEVTVRLPSPVDADASVGLARHLGLSRTLVLDGSTGDDVGQLGRLAAELLTESVSESDVLGLSCSRSVTAMTHSLRSLAACDVVQLTGTLAGFDGGAGSVESVRRAAEIGGGTAYPVYAPMLLPDAATAASMAAHEEVRRTFDRIRDVTVAAIAIGAWGEGLSTVWAAATPAERAAGAAAGVVGEISGRGFDEHGRGLAAGVDARVLGLTLDQLRAIPEVIALSRGAARARAVRAAAEGGLMTTLVCDRALGQALLGLPAVVRDAGAAS